MVHVYKPKGVCSREMAVEVDENGIVQSCVIKGAAASRLLPAPISSPMRWKRLWLLPSKSRFYWLLPIWVGVFSILKTL